MDFELTDDRSYNDDSDEEQQESLKKPYKKEYGLFDDDELENSESI